MTGNVQPSNPAHGPADVQARITEEVRRLTGGASSDPLLESLTAESQRAAEHNDRMMALLDKFYGGEISAAMLAANPALQLYMQQALQWENRVATVASKLLEVAHETRKELIRGLRA